jgi:hypothetical protein
MGRLWSDDPRPLRLGVGLRKLPAQKLQIDSSPGASIGPIADETGQKDKKMKYLGILQRGESNSLGLPEMRVRYVSASVVTAVRALSSVRAGFCAANWDIVNANPETKDSRW